MIHDESMISFINVPRRPLYHDGIKSVFHVDVNGPVFQLAGSEQ